MKILLCTDGSRYALAAARFLAERFHRPGAAVDLLAVTPRSLSGPRAGYGRSRAAVTGWRPTARRWLEDTARPLRSQGFRVTPLIRVGSPAAVVVKRVAEGDYDLVVVGARGRSDAPFFDIGSVALAVLEHAPAAVLMVRARTQDARRRRAVAAARALSVLMAVDGGPASSSAVRRLPLLLEPAGAQTRVLAVADGMVGGTLAPPDALVVARRASAALADHGFPGEVRTREGRPAAAILEEAMAGVDLVVMASRPVERTEERHLGSVSLEVARSAPCSVLLLRETVLRSAPEEAPPGPTAVAFPFDIAYRGVKPSRVVERHVLRGLARLEAIAPVIVRARVTVGLSHPRRRSGNLYRVGVHVTVPGAEVSVSRVPPRHSQDEVLVTAIGEAFDRARQRLLEALRRRRLEVKAHATPAHGRVVELAPEHGFLETADGERIYFHRAAVLDGGWDALSEGSEVRYVAEEGDQGPQASTVRIVGKHHLVP